MRIKILQDGDKVIGVTSDFIVVERISGGVDIIPLGKDESGIWVDTEHITTICYGDNVVEVETENGVKITNF
jgi:hypothetical protein